MTSLLLSLTPDTAILILTLGVALIAVELNRPGAILPGTFGLLLTLLAFANLLHHQPDPTSIALLIAASATLLLQLRVSIPLWAATLATVALITGFLRLLPISIQPHIHPAAAIPCGLALGAGTTVLTRLARLARQNKGLD